MKNIFAKWKIDISTYLFLLMALWAGYFKAMLLLFGIVIWHELGHVFFFKLFHIEIIKIVIYPFGGLTYIQERLHERIYKSFFCSIGGLLFQILLLFPVSFLYNKGLLLTSTYHLFLEYNKHIFFFNCLPLIPLDGSKAILCLFSKICSFQLSYLLMIVVGSISFLLFYIYNLVFKVNDLIIYVFLLVKLWEVIKEYKYVMNRFYLERVLYNHYYNKIISDCDNLRKLKVDKYYYFKENNKYVKESDYIKEKMF